MSDVEMLSTPPSPRRRAGAGLRCLAFAVVVSSVMVPMAGAWADPVSNTQSQLNQVNSQLQGAQAQAASIAQQLQADGARLDVLAQQYENAQQQVQQLDAQLEATKSQIAADQAKVDTAQTTLRQAALSSYMSGATDSSFDSLFSSGGVQAMVSQEYQQVATSHISSAIDQLHNAQQALTTQQTQLQVTESQARTAEAQAATAQQQAQAVQSQQQSQLNQVKGQIATLVAQKQQAEAAAAAAAFAARVAAEQAAAAAASHGGGGGGGGGGGSYSNVPVSQNAQGAVQAAESQIGVPYQWGGEEPGVGFDCSGLTQWAWGRAGVSLPRTAEAQYEALPHVSLAALQPGDLVFWNDGTSSVQHVGMYVGNGDVVHAPQTGQDVQVTPIWANGLVGAGRP